MMGSSIAEEYTYGLSGGEVSKDGLARAVRNLALISTADRDDVLNAAGAAMANAGFGEETVFRGYLFERLGKLLGSSARAKAAIVLLTAAWFGLAHYRDQGLAGAEQATIVGLVFGTIFAVSGRIWMLMVAHAAFDLVAIAIIYWNLESKVAHLVFK